MPLLLEAWRAHLEWWKGEELVKTLVVQRHGQQSKPEASYLLHTL